MQSWLLALVLGCAGGGAGHTASTPPTSSTPSTTDTSTPSTTTASTTTPTGSTTPTTSWACRSDIPDAELHGDYPPAELPPPEFTVQNYDGSPRTADDLVGHLTVMWFYPAAATSG